MVNLRPIVYVAVVALAGLGLLAWVYMRMRRMAQLRREKLEGRRRLDALATESPVDNPTELARMRGIASIEEHFTVTRRLVFPIAFLLVLFVAGLPFLDRIPAASVSLLVAALTVLVGIAARPVVENAMAGLVISSSKIISIGDTVRIDDWYGTVEDITTTHTTIKVWDWRRYVLPNSRMLQSAFINYSLFDKYQWAYVEFWIAYDADFEKAREIALDSPNDSRYFANHEPPRFWVMEMTKEGSRCWVAAWADTPSDAWLLTNDMRTAIIRGFQRAGIATHSVRFLRAEP